MKSIFYPLAFVMLWLATPFAAQAQFPLVISHTTVSGPSVDTVKVYFRNTTSAAMMVGALNISFMYEDAETSFLGTVDDIFEAEWGNSFKSATVQNVGIEYDGTAYDRRWQYGNTGFGFPAPTVEIPTDGSVILGMKLLFENNGSPTDTYLEVLAENFANDITDEFGFDIEWGVQEFGTGAFPVEWLGFDAFAIEEQTAQLTWRTSSETQNDRFVVERSLDGESFSDIGSVKGAGTTQETQDYSFVDENVPGTIAYYRLRQVDFDGGESFSEQREVRFGSKFGSRLKLYPNPATDYVEIKGLAFDENFHLTLVDAAGREIQRVDNQSAQNGIIRIDLVEMPSGLYTVTAENIKTGRQQSGMLRRE